MTSSWKCSIITTELIMTESHHHNKSALHFTSLHDELKIEQGNSKTVTWYERKAEIDITTKRMRALSSPFVARHSAALYPRMPWCQWDLRQFRPRCVKPVEPADGTSTNVSWTLVSNTLQTRLPLGPILRGSEVIIADVQYIIWSDLPTSLNCG